MPRITINAETKQEIRAALCGLSGARAKSEAERWATQLDCHINRIYEVTKDLRPPRKQRTDKGARRAHLLDHDGMRFAAELCATKQLDPDLAIETARLNGFEVPVSLGTFRRQLREHGINRTQLRNPRALYRPFESKEPLDMFQFDISGLKERWVDVKTRRILKVTQLEVSKNHPNENRNRVNLWKFTVKDHYSRVLYFRFVACLKPNSCHVIEFLWEAFRELGIPLVLYTDNDAIIVSRRMRRAAEILNRAFAESGGFKLDQHVAGNPNATGLVENAHQLVEKFEKLIGVKYETPTVDQLNQFAVRVCERYNWREHRATGVAPMLRFREGHKVMRVPPPAILDSAFKAEEMRLSVSARLTISVDGQQYQLPRSASVRGLPNPFLNLAGQRGDAFKIDVVWPPEADYLVAIVAGTQYEMDRVVAVADEAGQYKSVAESTGQHAIKSLKASAAERKKAHRAAGTDLNVPLLDAPAHAAAASTPRPAVMPRKQVSPDLAAWAEGALGSIPPSMVDGRPIDYWTAASLLADEGQFTRNDSGQIHAADMAWLKAVYAGRDEMLDTELREQLAQRAERAESDRVVAIRTA